MSYYDFQKAATQIIRNPQTLLDDPDKFFDQFELDSDECSNLEFLVYDRFAQTYIKNMGLIRRRMTAYGIPLTRNLLGKALYEYLFTDLFDPKCPHVHTHHLAHAFCHFLLTNNDAQLAWQEKGIAYLEDVIKFEKAQAYLRSYTLPDSTPLAAQSLLNTKRIVAIALQYDIPQMIQHLNRIKQPDFSALSPTQRPVCLLMKSGDSPAQLPTFEIDLETHDFLLEQLKPEPNRVALPKSFSDLKALGIFREFRKNKVPDSAIETHPPSVYKLLNPNAPVWETSFDRKDTAGILDHYATYGFVKINSFYSPEEINEIRNNLLRYQRDIAPTVAVEDRLEINGSPGQYSLLGRIDYYDRYFRDLLTSPRVRSLAETLLGGKSAETFIQFFNIVPKFNPPTPPHQDAFNLRFPEGKLLNMWIPLQAINETNGCLHYIPKSHLEGPLAHSRKNKVNIVAEFHATGRHQDVRLFTEPGDILIHHGFTIHGSEPNLSADQRWALGFPYVKADQKPRISYEDFNRLAGR